MKRILLLTWTPAMWHPVVRFTSQMLSEGGYSVDILSRTPAIGYEIPGSADFGQGVRVHPIGRGLGGWPGRLDYVMFLKAAMDNARMLEPDVVVGYDMRGMAAAYLASLTSRGTKLVYHNLDLVAESDLGSFGRIAKRMEEFSAKRAELTIFSSPGRAQIFSHQVRVQREPLIVMNCQRRDTHESWTGELRHMLRAKGLAFDKLVVRLGAMGPGHGIEATIQSVCQWQGDWGLVLAGVPIESYLSKLQGEIEALGLGKKVVLLPSVPYSLWYDCLYSADLGIALYEPGNINHAHMAGAGNKLNLYLKAGIPSLLPSFPDFVAVVEQFGIGKCVDPTDPRAIAGGVNAILADSREYELMRQNAKMAFEQHFNFERQFRPVLDWLAEN